MIVSVTGHRPDKLGGYANPEAEMKLYDIAIDWLYANKPEKVITGMALGWDQIIARAATVCDIPFTAAIPFKGQETMWPVASQKYYNKLLGYASEIIIVSPGAYTSRKMHIRNEWMVDNSDMVLAMWNGSPGGTGSCIKYAQKQSKPIINLYDQFKV